MSPDPVSDPDRTPTSDASAKLGDIAEAAGLRRVHVLAWRDLDDVEAGGSEVHAHEVLQRWAEAGIDVTMRTSYAQGHPPVTTRTSYRVIRRAGRYLVFPRAALAELGGRHGECDALVEIWNGMPFFSPLWFRGPRTIWLHHVHAEMWRMVLPPNLARLGETLEHSIAPPFYRRTPIVTLSDSSKRELVDDLGFAPQRVHVVPPGIDPRFTPGGSKSPTPLVVAVGRLVPVKRLELLIGAVHEARASVPDAQLVLVGEGYERPRLQALVRDLGAEDWVRFAGRLDHEDLVDLYRRAWVLASASAREGWGMTLTEAAACGTPAVATRIAGHVDATADGVAGLLSDDPAGLGANLVAVLSDRVLRERLSAGALAHAARFTWDATARGTLEVLAATALRSRRRHAS